MMYSNLNLVSIKAYTKFGNDSLTEKILWDQNGFLFIFNTVQLYNECYHSLFVLDGKSTFLTDIVQISLI